MPRPPKSTKTKAAETSKSKDSQKAKSTSEKPTRSNGSGGQSGAVVGSEEKLWQMADKLRNNMDAAEYKDVVLGLVFLKYISDAFEEKRDALAADKKSGADAEDPDEYRAENIFWVPKVARWSHLQGSAKQATIGKIIDDAMVAIEAKNPTLKGVLQKDYGRPGLDKTRLGELIDLIGTIGLGDKQNRSRDVLGRVYEYFLTKFAAAEGKNGGQFYTPRGVVRVLVEMLAPYKGRVFDPAYSVAKTAGPGLIIGRSGVGSMGAVHYCPQPFWPHNTTLYVTDFLGNDPLFAYFRLATVNFRSFDTGSAQASLNRNHLYNIPILRPPPSEQREIARVLGALDDKSELNRKMNATLEAMARALFKSWFVDSGELSVASSERAVEEVA